MSIAHDFKGHGEGLADRNREFGKAPPVAEAFNGFARSDVITVTTLLRDR